MAFTDDFTGANGQPLSARVGWSLAFGEEAIFIVSNSLTKGATTDSSTLKVYYRENDGATSQSIAYDQSEFTATNWPGNQPLLRPFVLGSGTSHSTFGCYFLAIAYVDASTTSVQVQRYDNGSPAAPAGSQIVTLPGLTGVELRVSVSGGSPTLSVFRNGTQLTSFTDNDGNRKVTGRRGVLSRPQNAAGSGPIIDNYSDDGPPSFVYAQAGITEGANTAASSATIQARATATLTEGADTMNSAGVARAIGTSAMTEGANVVASTVIARVQAASTMTEGPNTVVSQIGTDIRYANAAVTEGANTSSGDVRVIMVANGASTEGPNTMSGQALVAVFATGNVVEGPNISAGAASAPAQASASMIEGDNTLTAQARPLARAFSTMIEGANIVSSQTVALAITPDARTIVLADRAPRLITLTQ